MFLLFIKQNNHCSIFKLSDDASTTGTGIRNKLSLGSIGGVNISEISKAFKAGGISDVAHLFSGVVTQKDKPYIDKFNKELAKDKSADRMQLIKDHMQGASKAAKELAKHCDESGIQLKEADYAADGVATSMLGAKVAAIALNAAISIGISAIVSLASKAINYAIHYSENIIEAGQEAASAIQDISSSLQENTTYIDENSKRFAELVQGFKNNSLTNDEYQEFLDISNHLAEIFPTLSRTYDENGNAIVQLTGDVDDIIERLQTLLETERELSQQKIADNLPDVYKGIAEENKIVQKKADKKEIEGVRVLYERNGSNSWVETTNNSTRKQLLENILDTLDIDYVQRELKKYYEGYRDGKLFSTDLEPNKTSFAIEAAKQKYGTYEEFLSHIRDSVSEELNAVNQVLSDAENEMQRNWTGVLKAMYAWMETDSTFQALPDDMQEMMNNVVNGLDFSKINNGTAFKNVKDLQKYFKNTLLPIFDNTKNKQQFQGFFNISTLFNGNECTVTDYKEKVKEIISVIDGLDASDNTKNNIKIALGVDDKSQQDLEANIKKAKEKASGIAKSEVDNWIYSLNKSELEAVASVKLDPSGWDKPEWNDYLKSQKQISFTIDIDEETEGFNALSDAVTSANDALGVTQEQISSLTSRYKTLEEFDAKKLFTNTSEGVRLNTEELGKLESAYQKLTKTNLESKLDALKTRYKQLTETIKNAKFSERSALYADRSDIAKKIEETSTLIAQYGALTTSYNKWKQSQEQTDNRSLYEEIGSGYDTVEDLINRGFIGDPDVDNYLDTIFGEHDRTANEIVSDFNKIKETISGTSYSIKDFFQFDDDGNITTKGLENFVNAARELNSEAEEFVTVTKDANGADIYSLDLTGEKLDSFCEKMGISKEMVNIFALALKDAKWDVDFDSVDDEVENFTSDVDVAVSKLKELQNAGKISKDFNFEFDFGGDRTSIEKQMNQVSLYLNSLKKNGKVDMRIEGAEEAAEVLYDLRMQKALLEAPAVMKVTLSEEDLNTTEGQAVALMQKFESDYAEWQVNLTLGNTEKANAAFSEIQNDLSEMRENSTITTTLGIKISEDGQNGISNVTSVLNQIKTLQDEQIVTLGLNSKAVDEYDPDDINKDVTFSRSSDGVDRYISYIQNLVLDKTITFHSDSSDVSIPTGGGGEKATGMTESTGTAYAGGRWGLGSDGTALVGELGQEMVVRNGRFFTIGDKSAEMFRYKKDDIIFNADQTEQILKYGKITRGKVRGRAYAQGKAFNGASMSGSFYYSGSSSSSSYSSDSSYSDSSYDSSSDEEDTMEKVDWIETAIDRIERAINKLKDVASSAFKTITERMSGSADAINKITDEISLQQRAYDRYMQEAGSVGLSAGLASKVRDGTIDIEEYDEDTRELIDDYKEWYEKALDCAEAVDELHNNLAELYQDEFSAIEEDYENQLSLIEHRANMFQNSMDLVEEQGYFTSKRYYSALVQNSRLSIETMNRQLSDLEAQLQRSLDSGEIAEYSSAWYDMVTSINDVKENIADARVELVKFGNEARQIDWDVFDYKRERVSRLTEESDFAIDVLSHKKLYNEDTGALSMEGVSTIALNLINRETYLRESKKYADEILKINAELAKDPNNQELIKQRDEWIDKQHDVALAALEAEDAIVDMVKNGIELEIDAIQKLVDSYKDELDNAKDLYDYQKKIKEETSDIAILQKKISALSGDTSAETQAQIQKMQVELSEAEETLQESEYEQYITDQKSLLDEFAAEYEEILNRRFDDTDQLIREVTEAINTINTQGIIDEEGNINTTIAGLPVDPEVNGTVDAITKIPENEKLGDLYETVADAVEATGVNMDESGLADLFGKEKGKLLTNVETLLGEISGNILIGDGNGDGTLTADDARLALRYANGKEELTPEQITRLDVNGDGEVTVEDANIILQRSAKLTGEQGLSKTHQQHKDINASVDQMAYDADTSAQEDLFGDVVITASLARKAFLIAAKQLSETALTEAEFVLADIDQNGKITSNEARLLLRIAAKQATYPKFASGGLVDFTGLAQLDGTKSAPELVLNPSDTRNFISLRDTLRALQSQQAGLLNSSVYGTSVLSAADIGNFSRYIVDGIAQSGAASTTVNVEAINVQIDHVEDYDDFVTQLKKDRRFENFIQSVTVDRLAGRNTLAKNKY